MRQLFAKVPEIRITGGEPCLHPNFAEIVTLLKKAFSLSLVTNGTYLEKYIDLLGGIEVQISLYSFKPELHDQVTNSRGHFSKLIKSLRTMVDRNVDIKINSPLVIDFEDNIEGISQLCSKLGIKKVTFSSIVPMGRASKSSIVNRNIEQTSDTCSAPGNHFARLPCGAGDISFTVSPDGSIRPCQFTPTDFRTGDFMSSVFTHGLFSGRDSLPIDSVLKKIVSRSDSTELN